MTVRSTPIDHAGLYRLMAWLSPSFPTGGYSYSHGLEYAIEAGLVSDRDSLIGWVEHVVRAGTGRVDAMLFRAAYEAADDPDRLAAIVELAASFRSTAELALETANQGAAFLGAIRRAWPSPRVERLMERHGTGPIALPVAVAAACAGRIELALALAAYLQAFATNLVSAGLRLVPLGQIDGQRAVAALEPAIAQTCAAAMVTPLDEIGTAAPMVDWASMRHETQYTRLFRS